MLKLPPEYTKQIFFQYAGSPEKTAFGYRASCPMCNEGKSWGKKKRLYFFPNENYLFCHNGCGGFSDYFWVKTITGNSFLEIKKEIEEYGYDYSLLDYSKIYLDDDIKIINNKELPDNSINLFDKTQMLFYRNNYWVKIAVSFIIKRGILHAPYKPKALFLSLTDKIHKNRLIIPFYDDNGNVEFYQSRALTEKQEKRAKFLSKFDSDKSIFNLDKIDHSLDYVFIMEGALDAMFLKNGLAISGVYMTELQENLLRVAAPLHRRIWIFDNPKIDNTGRDRLLDKIKDETNDLFFSWNGDFEYFKDLNEFCVDKSIFDLDPMNIIDNSYSRSKIVFNL